MKTNTRLLIFCTIVLSTAGVLAAFSWKPLPWYHWLFAALALPSLVFIVAAVANFYTTVRQPKILLSSDTSTLTISLRTTAADIRDVLGPPIEQRDDDSECCLEYPRAGGTIRFMCGSARSSHGRFQYLELTNEKPGSV
jgi:hypothetical protein